MEIWYGEKGEIHMTKLTVGHRTGEIVTRDR